MFGTVKPAKKSRSESLREQLRDLNARREAIIEESTARKLARLESEESDLIAMLRQAERDESSAKSASPQSPEESQLWAEIRDIMDQEQDVMRRAGGTLPQRYIRPDAVAHFTEELAAQRRKFESETASLQSHQRMGPRQIDESNRLDALERRFPAAILPLCKAGERVFALRQKRTELSARRDGLRQEREAAVMASL